MKQGLFSHITLVVFSIRYSVICCIIYLRFYNCLICYISLSMYLISLMFCELDNVHVLFRLGGPPRIAPLTAGYPGLCILICIE